MYTFEQLKEDVRKEAEALKIHATAEERGRLDIERFKPSDTTCCIYGLVAFGCHTKRAAELIDKCAVRHFDYLPDDGSELNRYLADKPKDFIYERINKLSGFTFSAIEAYILLPETNNLNLIAYLRGETDTLTL